MAVIFFLDGVLRKPKEKSPILDGVRLYKSLHEDVRTLIMVDDKEEAERWMRQNNMAKKIDDLISASQPGTEHEGYRKVQYVRSQGPVEFVVTDDVDLAKLLLETGVTVYLFLSPKYMRPEFRPDGRTGSRSWADIEAELDRQQELFAEDPRV
jgi:hypothetical protein